MGNLGYAAAEVLVHKNNHESHESTKKRKGK
jgi:hypothetical protein